MCSICIYYYHYISSYYMRSSSHLILFITIPTCGESAFRGAGRAAKEYFANDITFVLLIILGDIISYHILFVEQLFTIVSRVYHLSKHMFD